MGKTVVSAALAAIVLERREPVRVLKPVQTGAGTDDDAGLVNRLVGADVALTGWRFDLPAAPAVAARLEGARLVPAELCSWVLAHAGTGTAIVETAGGVAVELSEGYDMADLAAWLGVGVVLVCRAGLGTLNHTVLSVEHLRARRADILGLVLSDPGGEPDPSQETNPAELRRLTGLPILGTLGPMPLEDPARFRAEAARALGRALPDGPRIVPPTQN